MLSDVEGSSIGHDLPELYRAVLERVASLEHTGHRDEGLLIRRAAVAAYSRAWDESARKRLDALRVRAERVIDGAERPRRGGGMRAWRLPRLVLPWSRTA
jgi:hypothetical protein